MPFSHCPYIYLKILHQQGKCQKISAQFISNHRLLYTDLQNSPSDVIKRPERKRIKKKKKSSLQKKKKLAVLERFLTSVLKIIMLWAIVFWLGSSNRENAPWPLSAVLQNWVLEAASVQFVWDIDLQKIPKLSASWAPTYNNRVNYVFFSTSARRDCFGDLST